MYYTKYSTIIQDRTNVTYMVKGNSIVDWPEIDPEQTLDDERIVFRNYYNLTSLVSSKLHGIAVGSLLGDVFLTGECHWEAR